MAALHASAVLVALALSCFMCASAQLFPAMWIFGDSLVDDGNNNYMPLSLAKANFPPNGIDFPTGLATGRFCNGKTSFDVVCDYIGLAYPPPAAAPSSVGTAILGGLNYASGAAGILNGTGAYFIERITADAQIAMFRSTVGELNLLLNLTGAADLLRRSLFALVLGSNDYINNYLLPFSSTGAQYNSTQYEDHLISTYRTQLTTLYNLGARKFLVDNIGPVGCMPYRLAIGNSNGSCVASDNQLVLGFNAKLRSLTIELTKTLSGSMFLYNNVHDTFANLVKNAASAGFTVVNQGCCGAGRFNGQVLCLPVERLCPNRDVYIFWDPYHPTQAVNEILGRRAFLGPHKAIYPMNVRQLAKLHL